MKLQNALVLQIHWSLREGSMKNIFRYTIIDNWTHPEEARSIERKLGPPRAETVNEEDYKRNGPKRGSAYWYLWREEN